MTSFVGVFANLYMQNFVAVIGSLPSHQNCVFKLQKNAAQK